MLTHRRTTIVLLFGSFLVLCSRNTFSFAPRALTTSTTAATITTRKLRKRAPFRLHDPIICPSSSRPAGMNIRQATLTDKNNEPENKTESTVKAQNDKQTSFQGSVSRTSQAPANQKDTSTSSSLSTVDWVDESKHVEFVGLVAWMATVSIFILVNNFVGPWPDFMHHVPERVWFLGHMMGAMLFGGGVVLTTAVEWLVCQNKNTAVMQFWFDKVPLLDMSVVLPGLTLSMFSGTGLTIVRYGGLALAPAHIRYAFWALLAFAAWWALTDLTTQGSALNAVLDLSPEQKKEDEQMHNIKVDVVPNQITDRLVSNLVSCLMVFVVYAIMVLKPGTLHYHW